MSESGYRDPSEALRNLFVSLQGRAGELGARVDRGCLARVDPDALADIDAKWAAAAEAARAANTMDGLSRACDLHQELIASLETVEGRGDAYRFKDEERARRDQSRQKVQGILALIGTAIIPVNCYVFFESLGRTRAEGLSPLFILLVVAQIGCGIGACIGTLTIRQRSTGTIVVGVLGLLVGLGGPLGLWLAWVGQNLDMMGGAWGRPLRLRGRVLHPELRVGADWTRGERPDAAGLDAPTRAALEALWLHDAQKEHASVPALSRVSWLLAAVGAPADLVEAVHVAALEEIEHTRLCFALAAGYGGRSHTVEPMPELVAGGLDLGGDPLVRIAIESLNDGCLLEDFNADVATLCARGCRDRAAREVLGRIAREERSHAELSWRLLAFALERGGTRVARAIERTLGAIDRVARPTAASSATAALVARADRASLRAHGRLPDAEWAEAWRARLDATHHRARALVASSGGAKTQVAQARGASTSPADQARVPTHGPM